MMASGGGNGGGSSSPIVLMNSMTPSPRAPSASSSPHPYQQHHTPNASPQHFIPQSRTPPSQQLPNPHQQSPKHDSNGQQYGQQCYDMAERLKNRIDRYRAHHQTAQQKDYSVMEQTYSKMKMETNRLRKQMAVNDTNTNTKSKKSSVNSAASGNTGTGRARNGAGAKRSAAAAQLNVGGGTLQPGMMPSGANATGGTVTAGPTGRVAKVPKMTAKQKRLLKQQQLDSMIPNSQLMMNTSTATPPTSAKVDSINGVVCSGGGSSVYKFDPNSPIDMKPQLHLISNNNNGPINQHIQPNLQMTNGPSYHNQQMGQMVSQLHSQAQQSLSSSNPHQQIKQEMEMSPYFVDVDAIQDILDSTSNNIPDNDNDSKDIINELLGSENSTPIGNGPNQFSSDFSNSSGRSMFDFSDTGFGTDDTLVSNKFGDENFIAKFLKDLDNYHLDPSPVSTASHLSPSTSVSTTVDTNNSNNNLNMINGADPSYPTTTSSTNNNNSFIFNNNHSNSSSHPSTPSSSHGSMNSPGLIPTTSTSSNQMNPYSTGGNCSPMFQSMRQGYSQSTTSNSPLPSINTLSKVSNQTRINNQNQPANPQVPNSQFAHQQNQLQQMPNSHQRTTPSSPFDPTKNTIGPTGAAVGPGSNNSIKYNTCAQSVPQQQMMLPGMNRPNQPPGPGGGNVGASNLLLQPVSMNQSSNDHRMSPMISRANNTPSPHHQSVSPQLAMQSVPVTNSNPNNGPNASVKLKQMAQQQQNKQPWSNAQTGPPCNEFYPNNPQGMMNVRGNGPMISSSAPSQQNARMSCPQPSMNASMYNTGVGSNSGLMTHMPQQQPQQFSLQNKQQLMRPRMEMYGNTPHQMPGQNNVQSASMGPNFYNQQHVQRASNQQLPTNVTYQQPQSMVRSQQIRSQSMRMPSGQGMMNQQQMMQQRMRFNGPQGANMHQQQQSNYLSPSQMNPQLCQQQPQQAQQQRFSNGPQNYWIQQQQHQGSGQTQQQQPMGSNTYVSYSNNGPNYGGSTGGGGYYG